MFLRLVTALSIRQSVCLSSLPALCPVHISYSLPPLVSKAPRNGFDGIFC